MPTFKVTAPDGSIIPVNAPEGATEQQAIAFAAETWKPDGPQAAPSGFGEKMNAAIKGLPRQAGLTARHLIQGVADTAGIVANPIAMGMNALGMNVTRPTDAISNLMDRAGLPTPATPTERVVGDASRMLAGGGAMVKGANIAAQGAGTMGRGIAEAIAARPGLQAASAAGAGAAGGYTRETGGNDVSQAVAAIAGGLAAPMGAAALGRGANSIANTAKVMAGKQPPNINITINNALENSGYKIADIPKAVMQSIENDISIASRAGDLSPDAVRRLVDYRLVGANPARANLTLNPIDITQQKNLAKIGANSSNPKLQALAMQQYDNTGKMIGGLNALGANTADDAYTGGTRIMSALERTAGKKQDAINAAYESARAQGGGLDAQIDPSAFTQKAGDLLRDNLLEGSLPSDIRRILNDTATGKIPLTVRTAEQIKTAMGNLQRSSNDGGTRRAIGLVRQALDEAPLLPGKRVNTGNSPAIPGTVPPSVMTRGDDAIQAFNKARGLNRRWRGLVENTPALQAIEDGVHPDKFVQDYIIRNGANSTVMDVARLKNAIKGSPEAITSVREQMLSHLKAKATSGSPDEAMKFTQSGFNNALSAIGERKLAMFFNKQEINQLKAIGRVALYEQVQPNGSAVNNSNTAGSVVTSIFERLANNPITNKIPFGTMAVNDPAKAITSALQGRGATNIPNSLLLPQAKKPKFLPLSALLLPGLLSENGSN